VPSKKFATAHDPYLGRVRAKSIAPPHSVLSIRRCLAKFEGISGHTITSLFLTPSSQTPMDDTWKATLLNHSGKSFLRRTGVGPRNHADLGLTPQEPLALLVKMPETERNDLAYGEVADRIESDIISPNIRYCERMRLIFSLRLLNNCKCTIGFLPRMVQFLQRHLLLKGILSWDASEPCL
jgi:hypothetical protein